MFYIRNKIVGMMVVNQDTVGGGGFKMQKVKKSPKKPF
jgi:hypothetical protein